MTMPIKAGRGETKTTNEKSYVVGAKEFNRIVAGISGNLPITTTFRERKNIFPFKVSTQFKIYPKEHPKAESVDFKTPEDWVPNGTAQTSKVDSGVMCAVIEAGTCFCQDTANVGPTFTTEVWLLGKMAVDRIESEIEAKDYSSCIGNSKDPPSKCVDAKIVTRFRTYTWEKSLLMLKQEKYGEVLSFTGSGVKIKKATIPHPFNDLGCAAEPKDDERELFHSDIILQISRPKMKTAFDLIPSGESAGMSILQVASIGSTNPSNGESVIMSVPSYIPPPPSGSTGFLGFLIEAENDMGIDQFVIARVYLVSPPEKYKLPVDKLGEKIQIYFADFVRQYIFGNVCYGWTNMPKPPAEPADQPSPILAIMGVLAGGVAYGIVASMLAFTNTLMELVMAVLRQKKIDGSLWYV